MSFMNLGLFVEHDLSQLMI